MIFQVSSNSFCFIPFHSMNELLHHTFLKEGIVIHLPMDWLDVGLWYNWRKGVTFILCVIRRNFIPYHSVQSSGQPRLAQPSLPGLGWRAIFTTPLLESKGGPEPSLSPQVPAQAPVIRLRGQMPSHGSPWAKTRWRQSQALLLQLPRDSSGFMGWEGSRICGAVVGHFEEHEWMNLHSALDTDPHLPAKAPAQALTTTCLPVPKVGILGSSTTLCWVWQ